MNPPDDFTNPVPDAMEVSQSCSWVRENAAAYLLGGLETEESDQIAEHRMLCPECDQAIGRLQPLVSLIGIAPETHSPSPHLKDRLMASIASESRSESDTIPTVEAVVTPHNRGKAPWWNRSRLMLAPLMIAILLLGTWGIYAQSELTNRAERLADLERSNDALSVHLGSLQAGQLAFGGDTNSIQLMSVNEGSDDAGGVVVSGTGQTTAVFSVWNLPTDDDTYHVICESKLGELLAAGEIVVNENGNGTITITLPSPVTEYRAVHVLPTSSGGDEAVELLSLDVLQALLQDSPEEPLVDE